VLRALVVSTDDVITLGFSPAELGLKGASVVAPGNLQFFSKDDIIPVSSRASQLLEDNPDGWTAGTGVQWTGLISDGVLQMWTTSESMLTDVVTSPDGWYMEGMSIEVFETGCSSDEIGRIGVFSWSTVGFSSGMGGMMGFSAAVPKTVGFSGGMGGILGFSAAVPRMVGFSGGMGGTMGFSAAVLGATGSSGGIEGMLGFSADR
jgi:hypothetical protein